MDAFISRLHYPVTVLGPGRRAGIWLQGCSIRCAGCASLDTWANGEHSRMSVDAVLGWLDSLPTSEVDGVTVSGGEPTEQPEALAALLTGVQQWRQSRSPESPPADVLVFTGREPSWVDSPEAQMLSGADAVMAGPYVEALAGTSPLRGSENQQLLTLTELGRRLYSADALGSRTSVQIEVEREGVWMIGIPLPGDLARFDAAVQARGLRLSGRSWRS